ncbi:MAG TPA: ribosome biogenesis GTP-binding protein YihA/YsxC [Acidimicrobiales bacterium]|nr:ribosome biogenesis GTP-binding protein YihA/YsxC [Acidimicrobiales bacterium]
MSAPNWKALPDSPAEVAFIGRSNVGKSSLINALANRKGLAEVSSTPGRTRLLNLYAFDDRPSTVVDLPGYGYAKVSKQQRANLAKTVHDYLLHREPLEMILVLVDGEIGPTALDVAVLDDLRAEQLPHTIIATKHDKVKSSAREKRKRELAAKCQLEPGDVVWVSAATGVGIERLRGLVSLWLS